MCQESEKNRGEGYIQSGEIDAEMANDKKHGW